MSKTTRLLMLTLAIVAMASIVNGCGGSRSSVDGYSDDMLARKRVFVVRPDATTISLKDGAAYAYSRGVGDGGAKEMLMEEMRSMLSQAIDARLDSNTVLDYDTQPVGAVIPLNTAKDFVNGVPNSWEAIGAAAKEGNIDYLLIIHSIEFENTTPSDSKGRGDETATARFTLLDAQRKKLMTSGEATASISDPRTPTMTYQELAKRISAGLPFWVNE